LAQDGDGDLYDRRVRTTFIARLRDELKFDPVDALVAQIHRDIADARWRASGCDLAGDGTNRTDR
jgi:FAD synthase